MLQKLDCLFLLFSGGWRCVSDDTLLMEEGSDGEKALVPPIKAAPMAAMANWSR